MSSDIFVWERQIYMEKEKRSRTGTRRTTLAVLEILKTDTRADKPISITELVTRLRSQYSIHTSRDSVKAILSDLMEFYPGPDEILSKRSSKNDRYQYQYYYWTDIPIQLQENIRRIHEAIQKNRGRGKTEYVLSFQFNGYGSDKVLHPNHRIGGVLPLRVMAALGHYYLIGFFPQKHHPAHFRIDLMTEIQQHEQERTEDEKRDFQAGAVDMASAETYLATHPYMFYEGPGNTPRWIRFLIKKIPGKPRSSLTFLRDVFGDNWEPVSGTETDEQLEVQISCLPSAAVQFAWQYMDRVRILEPEEVKKQVEGLLRKYDEEIFPDF